MSSAVALSPVPRMVPVSVLMSSIPAAPTRNGGGDSFVRAVPEALGGAMRSFQALPSFIYPAVGGTAAEKQIIMDALSRLPLKDISAINDIRMVGSLGAPSSGGITLGVTRVSIGDMALSRSGNSIRMIDGFAGSTGHYMQTDSVNPDLLRNTVLHEAGHAHDYQGGLFRMLFPISSHGPWGKGPYVSDYAHTNAHEDYAESHAFYYSSPKDLQRVPGIEKPTTLQQIDPAKWKAMHDSEQSNWAERFVDRPAFRETGKLIGEWTSAVPLARAGLALLSSITVMNLMSGGVQEIVEGMNHDPRQAVHGALGLAAGLGLATTFVNPILGPVALAALGARRGLEVAARAGLTDARATTTKAAVSTAIGSAIGASIGGVVGPLGGTCAGYAIGGPVGGAIGLITGSILGFRGGSEIGARAGLAIGEA